jgi:predicted RNA binding protein YcfA (HicA-like mRNA interferase family)
VKLPRDLSGQQVVRALRRLGFEVTRQAGSHVRLAHADRRVTVPLHKSNVPGTLQNVLRQAGVTLERFQDALR